MFEGIEKDILTGASSAYINICVSGDEKGRQFILGATGKKGNKHYTRYFSWNDPDAKDDWGALFSIMTKLREWRQEVSDGETAQTNEEAEA